MPMPILTLTHGIPIWFLLLSLFLPRLSLFIGWIHMWWFFVPQPWAAVLWLCLPRVLVLIFIHAHQGFDLWFRIDLVTAVAVWGGSGASHFPGDRATLSLRCPACQQHPARVPVMCLVGKPLTGAQLAESESAIPSGLRWGGRAQCPHAAPALRQQPDS